MAGITIASTWDKGAFYERANMMGQEFRGKGVNIGLLPVCGPLGKNPAGGRYLTSPLWTLLTVGIGKDSLLIQCWQDGQCDKVSQASKTQV